MKIKGAFPVRWAAQDGKPGTGVTIVSQTVKYAVSTSGTTHPTSGWKTSVPSVSDGQYLWTWVCVRYSDGTETNSYSVARQGIDGRGIKSSSVTYSQQATSVDPATITDWGSFPSNLTDGYWLYTKTHIVYSDDEATDSYSVSQVGVGSYYAGCQEYWAIGMSDTTPPQGAATPGTYVNGQEVRTTWSQERVSPTKDLPYLWNFEVSADSRGNKYVTQSICIGNFAKGIVSMVETYAISAYGTPDKSTQAYPSDIAAADWKDEQNASAPTEAKRYQWNRTVVTYNSGDTDTFYHVSAVKGIDGKGAVYIDLDNENDSMMFDGQGNSIVGSVTSNISLYANGAKVSNPPAFSIQSKSNFLNASIANGVLTVSTNGFYANSASAGFVIVQCTYNGVVYTARMTVKKIVGTDKYEIALNHNAVSFNETEGTLSNATLTINIYRTAQNGTRTRVGDGGTTMTNLGLTAKVYPNGVSTNAETITFNSSNIGSFTLSAAHAAAWSNFAIVLFKNNVEWDRETVPINKAKNGATGTGAVILDLDNENDSMLYDGAGVLKSGNVTSHARLLVGGVDKTSEVSEWDCVDKSNVTASISNSGKITVTAMSGTSGSCRAKAKYGSEYYYATLTVKKLIGVDKFELVVSPNAFTYNTTKKDNENPTVNIKVYRTGQNGARTLVPSLSTYHLSLKYYYQKNYGTWGVATSIVDGTESGQYNSGVDKTINTSTNQSYRFELLDNSGNLLDIETVPISKTTDGGKGEDSVMVDLDNENDSILYDGADNPISDAVVSNASLYKGSTKVTSGITWSIASADGATLQNSGVATNSSYDRSTYPTAAWINSSGLVTVNGLTASQAKIVVRATYDSKTYDKTLTIKKLRGVDKYDLVISPAALTYNSSTELVNGASRAQVTIDVWRTAQNGTRTKINDFNGANKYGLSIELSPSLTLTNTASGGTLSVDGSMASSYSNITITLKKSSQTLDTESVPIAKTTNGSGIAGPAAKSIYANSFEQPATPTGSTPWTTSGSIWSESAVNDDDVNIQQQGDWYKDDDGYMIAPAIGTEQSSVQTLMFVTTKDNQTIHLRAKCSTSYTSYLYIGIVDSSTPTSTDCYLRRLTGESQDTGDMAINVASAGYHFICIAYTRSTGTDKYVKFICGKRFTWRSDAKTYSKTGAVATWTTPVKVSAGDSDGSTQTRGNLLQQTAFLPTRMDKWVVQTGSTTDGIDGRNGYTGTPNHQSPYKELIAQNVYEPSGIHSLLADTWYTLSFWAKADPYIHISKNVTSIGYGFAKELCYFEAGVTNTIWVNGYISSEALAAGKSLRVFVYGDGESSSSWGSTIQYVSITRTYSTTVRATFSVSKTGLYQIQAFVYLEPSGGNSAVEGHTATVNWYRIDRGKRISTYLYPYGVSNQSAYTAMDVNAGRIKDGERMSSTPTDNSAVWQLSEAWTRHTLTFKTRKSFDSAGQYTQRFLFRMLQSSNAVYICMPKLEQGTVATAYCTNDNDVADMAADETGFPNDRGVWSESPSESYMWNDVRRDYVAYEVSGEWRRFFVKTKGMTVPNGMAPTAGGNTYWEQGSVINTLLVNTLVATNASMTFAQSNRIYIKNSLGEVSLGMGGAEGGDYDYPFWIGETYENRANAPFKINMLGHMFSTRGYIGSWVIRENKLISQIGLIGTSVSLDYDNASFVPNITLDAINGQISAGNTLSIDADGLKLYNGKKICAKIVNQSISTEINTNPPSGKGIWSGTYSHSLYIPTGTAGYTTDETWQITKDLGYMYAGSTIALSNATFELPLPTSIGTNTIYCYKAVVSVELYCGSDVKTVDSYVAFSGKPGTGGTRHTSVSVNRTFSKTYNIDGSTYQEGKYYARYKVVCSFYCSGGSSGTADRKSFYLSNAGYNYTSAVESLLLIGQNGLFNRQDSDVYIISTKSGFISRYKSYVFDIGSSGIRVSNNGGSSWTQIIK